MSLTPQANRDGTSGTLSNEDGNANDDGSEKAHFWFTFLFTVQVIWVLFLCFKFWIKNDGMFLHEAKQILRKFLLLRARTLDNFKKGFSRFNSSDISMQVAVLIA